jgi:hypothetical protein
MVAKNMLADVLKNGIYTAADMLIRADLYNIYHEGFFAYDKPQKSGPSQKISDDTTIFNRVEGDNGYHRKLKNFNLDK